MSRRNALKVGLSALARLYLSPLLGQLRVISIPSFKGSFLPTWDL